MLRSIITLFLVCCATYASAQFNGCSPGLCNIGASSSGGGGTVGSLFLVDGTDPVFLVNGTSGVCLTGGGC